MVEGEDVVDDDLWREAQGRFTHVHLGGVVVEGDNHVLGAVLAEGGVGVPAQPLGGRPGSLQLYAHAVAFVDVLRDGLALVVQFACQHKLVLVVHPVEVDASGKTAFAVLIAHLEVVQALGLDGGAPLLLEVVARGFTMGDGVGGIDTVVTVDVVVETCLGIEEVEVAVQVVVDLSVVVPVVATSIHLIVHVAILQVGIGVEPLCKLPVHLRIDVAVGLA